MTKTPKRTEHIQIRVTPAEKAKIEKAAAKAGLTVASYVRLSTLTNS